ncbi:MAG: hypothetical protein H5T91_00160 [Synergistetes bacterium]|nr:hypothetical protein [Synergistota bacterium]
MVSFKRFYVVGLLLLGLSIFALPALALEYEISVNPTSIDFGTVAVGTEDTQDVSLLVTNNTDEPVDLIVNLTPGLGFSVNQAIWPVPANASNYPITLKVTFKPIDAESYTIPLNVAIGGVPGTAKIVTLTGTGAAGGGGGCSASDSGSLGFVLLLIGPVVLFALNKWGVEI